LEGYMYDRNSDIIVGDTILTSGMGEVYKEGVMVGVVDRVETDESNLKKNIYIKPAVDTRNITKVFVVN
ncbi:MAG: rod shape-determining protein MreC, partial [Ezakiella massiliensis]